MLNKEQDEIISAISRLIAGLHVPVSIGLPLGEARKPYTEVRDLINDWGWSSAEEIETKLKAKLYV